MQQEDDPLALNSDVSRQFDEALVSVLAVGELHGGLLEHGQHRAVRGEGRRRLPRDRRQRRLVVVPVTIATVASCILLAINCG